MPSSRFVACHAFESLPHTYDHLHIDPNSNYMPPVQPMFRKSLNSLECPTLVTEESINNSKLAAF